MLRSHASHVSERRAVLGFQLLVLGLAVVAAAATVAWLMLRSVSPSTPPPTSLAPRLVPQTELAALADALDRPIYWAGPQDKFAYELTLTPGGRVYVRYLPRGAAAAGDPRANFLTVGTYPGANSYKNLKNVSTGPAVHSNLLHGGGLLVAPKRVPKSVYIAFPGADYQVEVYDPSHGAARRLALDGLIRPIR
jgi:hypothetical protein